MAYYDQYFSDYPQIQTPFIPPAQSAQVIVRKRMLLILSTVMLLIVPLLVSLRPTAAGTAVTQQVAAVAAAEGQTATSEEGEAPAVPVPAAPAGQLAPVFTPEVRHWEPQILGWAAAHGLDPNLVAIIMQIESCGDPQAVSVAGAQGLFQVMPFHFAAGENSLDPETNASRGLAYFVERLNQTGGDIGKAFAGYNGGHVAAAGGWDDWVHETQRYYVWSTGIYADIQSGATQSQTVQQWLQAGGASLCRQAAARLGL